MILLCIAIINVVHEYNISKSIFTIVTYSTNLLMARTIVSCPCRIISKLIINREFRPFARFVSIFICNSLAAETINSTLHTLVYSCIDHHGYP